MSTMPIQPQAPVVQPKVRHPHPAAAAAAKFREETAHLRGGNPAQTTAVVNPQPVVQTPVQPPVVPSIPPITEPVQTAQNSTEPTLTPVASVKLPENYVDALSVVMGHSNTNAHPNLEQQRQAAPTHTEPDDNVALRRELEEARRQLEEARRLPDELARMKEEREIEQLLSSSETEFTTIDKEDAKKLLAPIVRTVREQANRAVKDSEARVQQLEQELQERFRKLDDEKFTARLNKTRDAILKAHPDLESLQKTPAYQQMMMSPIGGNAGLLVGQLVAAEYQRGNADYVINVLNQVKQSVPDLANVASVSPAAATTAPAPAAEEGGRLTSDQIAQYKFMVQTGQMSREDFRSVMKKHRDALR